MKGYTTVPRSDLIKSVKGFEARYANAKLILEKGIDLYYDLKYVNGTWWNRLGHKNDTRKQFVRSCIGGFGSWDDILHEVLTENENTEISWLCWTSENSANQVKSLYNASNDDSIINIDNDMAKFVVKYKNYLESI